MRAFARLKQKNGDPKDIETAKKLIQWLINQGADLNAKNTDGVTPFLRLVDCGLWELVAAVLNRVEQDENFKITIDTAFPNTKDTLLHVALWAFARLKQKNGDPKDIETAKKLIQWLINQGADLNAKNTDGVTPFGGLVDCELWELVAAVLNHVEQDENFKITIDTASPNTKDTLLHVALWAFARLKQKNGDPKDIETAKKLIQWLISQDADLNAKNTDGVTPFGGLVGCGLWELVAAVLNRVEQDENFKIAIDTAFPNTKNTLLHIALRAFAGLKQKNGDPKDIETVKKLIQWLISQGADLNAKNTNGVTPFLKLVDCELWELVAAVLNRVEQDESFKIAIDTAFPNTKDTLLYIALWAFARLKQKNGDPKDIETVKKLIQWLISQGADLNAKNTDGVTPFLRLVDCELWELVAAVLNRVEQDKNLKITINTAFPNTKDTLLHIALWAFSRLKQKNGDPKDIETAKKLIQWLISQDAALNAKNTDGVTPFLRLVDCGLWELVAAVLNRVEQDESFKIAIDTAFPNTKDTLLHIALRAFARLKQKNGDPKDIETVKKLIQWLISQGADLNAKNTDGVTPFLRLVDCELWELVAAVLNHVEQDENFKITIDTASPNTKDTLLHVALWAFARLKQKNGDPKDIETAKKLIQWLISQGADLNAKNTDGVTPFGRLVDCELWELVAAVLNRVEQDENFKITIDTAFPNTKDTLLHVALWAFSRLKQKNGCLEDIKIAEKLIDLLLKNNAKIDAENARGESPLTFALQEQLMDLFLKMCHAPKQTIILDNKLITLLKKNLAQNPSPQLLKLGSLLQLRLQSENKNEFPILTKQFQQDENEFRRAAFGQAHIESQIQRLRTIKKVESTQITISPSNQILPKYQYSLYSYLTDMVFPIFSHHGRDFYTFFNSRYLEHINDSYGKSWLRVASNRFFKTYNSYCTVQTRKLKEKDKADILEWIRKSLFEINFNETTLALVGKSAKKMGEEKKPVNEDTIYQMMEDIKLQQTELDIFVDRIIHQFEMDLRIKTRLEFQHGIASLRLHLVKILHQDLSLRQIQSHEAMKHTLCEQLMKIIKALLVQNKTENDFQKSKNKMSSLFIIKLADFSNINNPTYYTLFFQRAMLGEILSSVRPLIATREMTKPKEGKNKRKGDIEDESSKRPKVEIAKAEEENEAMEEAAETALDEEDESNSAGLATTSNSSSSSSSLFSGKRKTNDHSNSSSEEINKIPRTSP